jgi:adenylate cyclase class 2
MNKENIEIEAKFYLGNLEPLRSKLYSLGAIVTDERILERNWRFDTPDRRLTANGEVLRIREDRRIRLTYKQPIQGILERTEIELEVDNREKAKLFLEALGYKVFFIYEKYRETFQYNQVEIVLDEVPYGNFVEVEGPSIEIIQQACRDLHLNWDLRISSSYLANFERLKRVLHLPFRDATFEAFLHVRKILPDDLNIQDGFQDDTSSE